jgi:hypothetical protein
MSYHNTIKKNTIEKALTNIALLFIYDTINSLVQV